MTPRGQQRRHQRPDHRDPDQPWSWGGNNYGQLGTGSSALFDITPTDVGIHVTLVSSTGGNVAGF